MHPLSNLIKNLGLKIKNLGLKIVSKSMDLIRRFQTILSIFNEKNIFYIVDNLLIINKLRSKSNDKNGAVIGFDRWAFEEQSTVDNFGARA
jgi:hypothetical protein